MPARRVTGGRSTFASGCPASRIAASSRCCAASTSAATAGAPGARPSSAAWRRRTSPWTRDLAEVEQRSRLEARHHRNRRLGRRVVQQIGQVGVIQRMAGDRQVDGSLVVAEALQRRARTGPTSCAPGSPAQMGRPAPSRAARSSCEVSCSALSSAALPVGFRVTVIGLRIGPRSPWSGPQQECGNDAEDEHAAHGAHGNRVRCSPKCHGCAIVRKQ